MNSVNLLGRLAVDPEVRVSNDLKICHFRLAVDRFSKEKEADFFNVVCFKKTADFVEKYFKKGQRAAISGRLQTNNYTDKNGEKRYSVEIVANEINFADSKNNSDEVVSDVNVEYYGE